MCKVSRFSCLLFSAIVGFAAWRAPATAQPALELAPEDATDAPASRPTSRPPSRPTLSYVAKGMSEADLNRGLMEYRLRGGDTIIGGYGQLGASFVQTGGAGPFAGHASLRRLVLFVGHHFNEQLRIYTELEWENAVSGAGFGGTVEVEQALLDWRLLGDRLTLRTGLILVPFGIVNQWHEPPIFHGVERPAVDTLVIPTTWRELGIGVSGSLNNYLQYELYLMTALDPLKLSPANGLQGAKTLGSLSPANGWALAGRVQSEPILGLIVGASGYASDMRGVRDFYDQSHKKEAFAVPLIGFAADARYRQHGVEAKAVWAEFFFPNADLLMADFDASGRPLVTDTVNGALPTQLHGGYVELAYDLLRPFRFTQHQLLPFARLEYYDTQARVPRGYPRRPRFNVREYTYGLSYRPIAQVVFKADLQLRDRQLGADEIQINVGTGFMF